MPTKIEQLEISSMAVGGEGVGSLEGKKVFVPFAVVGDKLKIKVVENKKDYARGQIVEILSPSLDRVKPECAYYYQCGGCQWQHISYKAQVNYKNELLQQALQRLAKIEQARLLDPIASPQPYAYRNRVRFQVSQKGQVGFYKSSSNEMVEIERCMIAEEGINQKIKKVRNLAQELLKKNKTLLEEIEVHSDEDLEVSEKNLEDVQFSQVNTALNEELKQKVLEYLSLDNQDEVLELYAGSGNFSFHLASHAKTVTAVEFSEQAVESARKKIKKSHVKNLQFIQATAARSLIDFSKSAKVFDKILLDPPRAGAEDCIDKIAALKAKRIVYVSCDPATLARDVKQLEQLGYKHQFSQVIDMFPQTYHIESITVLENENVVI